MKGSKRDMKHDRFSGRVHYQRCFRRIDMKFLVSTHLFMPCDQEFAEVEKCKQVTKSTVPSEMKEMITSTQFDYLFF